ncbi:outer membrane protein [Methylobacterium gnaphalii]|uniref:Membrane protein n=1 Tax=Methylobacterium gnaphalii TaxID=1010610 RepID=A0A512JMY8_9HYPH|nr:outer membrane beta-barrel protein [Methylobacterium gnaphalii]GEP11330.1 membrane protein [Methylobacterium gnaphalii]GJD67179.1 hypothetical protein MMMDOFMJ_0093 [Methylobacterium gnaphalii]GLS50030.1 membrane protein [Methylobacterium gnaphalii]
MKKLLLASTVLAGLTAVASAADLPRRAAAPEMYSPLPVFTWTGFYAGLNAGYGFGTQGDQPATVIGTTAASGLLVSSVAPFGGSAGAVAFSNRSDNSGFVGGGQIGYNYQFTPGSGIVVGIEADAQYADFGRNRNNALPGPGTAAAPGVTFFNPNGLSGLDFFGTVRGRVGYAFDRTLVYGTAGFAYGAGGGRDFGLPNSSTSDFQTGYAVGGGVEYALPTNTFLNVFNSSAVTLKLEGLYVDMDRGGNRNAGGFAIRPNGTVASLAGGDGTLFAGSIRRQDTEFAVVRAGINYKFGSF